MATPTTPEEAVYARLASDAAVAGLSGGRVTPQISTQEVGLPCVVYQRTGREAANRLNGTSRTGKFTVTVTVYADTEAEAHRLSNAVQDRLCPDGGWQDRLAGVQGCFAGDSTEDVTDDGIRVVARPFVVVWQPPPAPSSLLTGLVSYWTLDEVAGTRADALAANDLTDQQGDVGQTTGKLGNCAVFTGAVGQRLVKAAPTFVTAEQNWTLSVWFYFAANPSPAVETYFLCKGDPGFLATGRFGVSDGFGSLMVRHWSGSGFAVDTVTVAAMPAAGQWHHLVAWQDAAGGLLGAALDGGAAVTAAKTLTQANSGVPFALGNLATKADSPSAAVRLDACGVWSRVLSGAERAALWNGGVGKDYPF